MTGRYDTKGNTEGYFMAIQAGLDCNYEPMKALVKQALLDSQ